MPDEITRESGELMAERGNNRDLGERVASTLLLCVLCVLGGQLLTTGCADGDGTIRYLRSESYAFTRADRMVIRAIAESTFAEVRRLLPGTRQRLEITVRPGNDVIQETGETGAAMPRPAWCGPLIRPSQAASLAWRARGCGHPSFMSSIIWRGLLRTIPARLLSTQSSRAWPRPSSETSPESPHRGDSTQTTWQSGQPNWKDYPAIHPDGTG